MANPNIGKVGNLGNLRKVIPSFQFCPTAKIENSDLKISGKNFLDFLDFRVFGMAHGTLIPMNGWIQLNFCLPIHI